MEVIQKHEWVSIGFVRPDECPYCGTLRTKDHSGSEVNYAYRPPFKSWTHSEPACITRKIKEDDSKRID